MARPRKSNPAPKNAQSYQHPDSDLALRMEFEDTVWDHLAGTTSAPFPAREHQQIAVEVIDPRGNELLVVKKLEEGK